MGASVGTPAKCPLCSENTSDLITLPCVHRFCQRCIGDLWSTEPDGPYQCPQPRCKKVYRTLPFDRTLIPRQWLRSKRGARTRRTPGTPNNEPSTSDSALRTPSLAGRLLGKRKASAPAAEQPDTKRSTVEALPEPSADEETPTSFSSFSVADTAAAWASPGVPRKSASQPSVFEEGTSSSLNQKSGHVEASGQKPEPTSVAFASLHDGDCFDEVIICDIPPPETTQRETGEAPAPASAHSSAGVPPDKANSPYMASTSGSPSSFDSFFIKESKSAGPVPCHYCPKTLNHPAIKTCLVCGASMCSEHLSHHLETPVFQNHPLVPPVEDISSWRCQEHQEINRIYCRQCAVCICTMCTVIGSHRNHTCISTREAERELRGNLKEEISQMQQTEDKVTIRLKELTEKKEASELVLEDARMCVQQQYAAIREALDQEEQTALQCVTKEGVRVLVGLRDKLNHLSSFLQSIQQGLYILEGLADAKGDKHIGEQAFIMEYSKTAQLAKAMRSYMEQFKAPEEVDQARLTCMQKWTEKRLDTVLTSMSTKERDLHRILYGCVPSLDADTAHPMLQLSDNRRVTYSETQQPYTEHAARFNCFPQVVASCSLQGGRWYWEVMVSVDEGRWKVGVCEGQMERKGQSDDCRLGCNPYSWCLAGDRRKVEALHNKVSEPVNVDRLQWVGVYLNFEEGLLSFFEVTPGGSLVLMHSYKHSFSGPVYPALSVTKTHLEICDLYRS